MDTSLGAGGCLLLLQRLSLRFMVARGVGSAVTSHCNPCLLLEGGSVFCTRRKVACNSPLSSGLRARQTPGAMAVLSLQLSGHRPASPRPVCLHPAPAQTDTGFEKLLLAWERLSSVVSSLVEWQVIAYREKLHDRSPFILACFMRTCLIFFVFWICLYKTSESPCFSGYSFCFALTIAKF